MCFFYLFLLAQMYAGCSVDIGEQQAGTVITLLATNSGSEEGGVAWVVG